MAAGLSGLGLAAAGGPYTPSSDDEILERMPPGLRSADLRRQRAELAQDPENLRDSVDMARSYLDTARSEGDARFLGHAQAILSPWWDLPSPPAPVLVLRGLVRAATWEFDRAMADLDAALAADPDNPLASLTRLEILLARGDLVGARAALASLASGVSPLARATAEARVNRFGGDLAAVAEALTQALSTSLEADPAERHAAVFLLADLAEQKGQPDAALRHYEALEAGGRRDVQRLAAQADLLLSLGRAREAVDRLKEETAVDSLALRLVEALAALPRRTVAEDETGETLARRVGERLEARRRRGEALVVLEETRFLLRPGGDPRTALRRALELWSLRREPGDARLVWRAARAAGEPDAARPVLEWLRAVALQDARLPDPK